MFTVFTLISEACWFMTVEIKKSKGQNYLANQHRSSATITPSEIKGCFFHHINISTDIKSPKLFLRSPEIHIHCFHPRAEQTLHYGKCRRIKINNLRSGDRHHILERLKENLDMRKVMRDNSQAQTHLTSLSK